MSLIFLGASAALAAAPSARVAGLGTPRSVALLVKRGDEVAAIGCNDAGNAPDESSDAIWTCGPLPPVSGAVRLGVVREGRLLDAGTVEIDGTGPALVVEGAAARVGALPPPIRGAANPGLPTVVARVTGLGDGSAPVLRLQGAAGAVELMCRDDGVFPDTGRNDGAHGCAGPAPGPRAEIFVNAKDGVTKSFGSVAWDVTQPLGYLLVDGAAGTSRVEVFPIDPFPAVDPEAGKPPPAPTPVAPTPLPEAPPTAERPPEPAPERSPVATREALATGGVSPAALVAAFVLGAGGAFVLGRRSARLPALLRPHPAPPLLPGGFGLAESPVAIRTEDPEALAAALLPTLARHRRVVVVAEPGARLPPVPDGPVYRVEGADCEEVEAAVRALARTPGPPVAVLVVGEASVSDPGAVAPDPLRKLRIGLGERVWLGVLHGGAPPEGYAAWKATGPPWALVRATMGA